MVSDRIGSFRPRRPCRRCPQTNSTKFGGGRIPSGSLRPRIAFIDSLITMTGMEPLEPPDSHHVNAAAGWLALGCGADAQAELDRIAPECQQHPDVLEVRWEILATEKRWEAALEVARKLLSHAPERASS